MKEIGFRIETAYHLSHNTHKLIPPADFKHVLCVGATGSGKTASVILPTLDDRIQRGHTILFFDHKGHEHRKVKHLAQKAGRLEDVVEIGKPHSAYINLLSELDIIRLKAMIREEGATTNAYWSNSAANLFEDIMDPLRRLYEIVRVLRDNPRCKPRMIKTTEALQQYGVDFDEQPSFQLLSYIVSTPERFMRYKKIIADIPEELERILKGALWVYHPEVPLSTRQTLLGKILSFKKSVKAADRFTLDEKADNSTGNNGVMQILDNTIAAYAKKEYINRGEYTLSELMEKNAIIVVDTQSFGEDILKLFLESLLQKSVMRLKTGTQSPMSIFIDEANRVLYPSIDLHGDEVREAMVELIIAIQNEEQMRLKFTQTGWESIRGNIQHRYIIDAEHRLSYNDHTASVPTPVVIETDSLLRAERAYNRLEKNRANIEKNFLSSASCLPESFTVVYDLAKFDREASILLLDESGNGTEYSYHGEAIVSEVRKAIPMPSAHPAPKVSKKKTSPRTVAASRPKSDSLFWEEWADDADLEEYLF